MVVLGLDEVRHRSYPPYVCKCDWGLMCKCSTSQYNTRGLWMKTRI